MNEALHDHLVWVPDDLGRLEPRLRDNDVRVAWAPQPGSQTAFLECPLTEVLYEGNRGGGKTDCLLVDFNQFCGRGYGSEWRGILFRKQKVDLEDVISKSRRIMRRIFPAATYNEVKREWKWPTGESLRLSHFATIADYDDYHGGSFTWLGWEELTLWASDDCYTSMFSVLRSPIPSMPLHVRSTTNPYGRGHNWVKERFGLPVQQARRPRRPCDELYGDGVVGERISSVDEHGLKQPDRVAIHGSLAENKVLLNAQPNYASNISAAAKADPMKRKAWVEGDWDIVAGGIIDDLWDRRYHVLPPIPPAMVPKSWRLDRSYDDGQSKPFSVGWWAQSPGEPIEWEGVRFGAVRGDVIRVAEWYGWNNGEANVGSRLASRDIARGIVEREKAMGVTGRVRPGPADGNIWNVDPKDNSTSVASEMEKAGVSWEHADKRPGSRKQGWKLIRDMLAAALPRCARCLRPYKSVDLARGGTCKGAKIGAEWDGKTCDSPTPGGMREQPGLFVTSACAQFIRTMPILPRDEADPDDVDTECEDHIADETRYRVRRPIAIERPQGHLVY